MMQLPDLPVDPEAAELVWTAGRFWLGVLGTLLGFGGMIWVMATKFSKLDTTLQKLDSSVNDLSSRVSALADHESRLRTIERWRTDIDAWMRRRNGG